MNDQLIALREALTLTARFPKGPSIRVIDRPGWIQLINTEGRSVYQNSVYITEFPRTMSKNEVEIAVRLAISEYAQLGLNFRWITGPWTRPGFLEKLLIENGLSLGRRAFGMTRSSSIEETASNPRLRIEAVNDSNANLWAQTYSRAWESSENSAPAQRAFVKNCLLDARLLNHLAYYDGIPAGIASSAFLQHSAYFSNSAVLPEFRSKGIFRELVKTHCRAAVERGQTMVSLYAFEDTSFPILKKMGFDVACESPQYFYIHKL